MNSHTFVFNLQQEKVAQVEVQKGMKAGHLIPFEVVEGYACLEEYLHDERVVVIDKKAYYIAAIKPSGKDRPNSGFLVQI